MAKGLEKYEDCNIFNGPADVMEKAISPQGLCQTFIRSACIKDGGGDFYSLNGEGGVMPPETPAPSSLAEHYPILSTPQSWR